MSKSVSTNDEQVLNRYRIPNNENLNDYAMQPIMSNSLFIKNGVMYILGGVSSGKSTLLSKLMAVYNKEINPIILSFYAGMTPDETTTFALSNFNIKDIHYIKLITPEAMMSFFNQFRYKRIKLAELLMFLQSIFKNNIALLLAAIEVVNELSIEHADVVETQLDYNKRVKALLLYVNELLDSKRININPNNSYVYLSEYLMKTFANKHKINFNTDPIRFIAIALICFSKGFKPVTITVDNLNEPNVKLNPRKISSQTLLSRFTPYTFKPFIRIVNKRMSGKQAVKLELVPSISIFDDVAQFPLLTSEHSSQWTKDLFAETRRWMNTFIIAAQRHNLLNKTLRSLTHTFFIGYSLVDDDIPKIAKEIPSNLLNSRDFILLYTNVIKPFTFFVYNNKLGYNILKLKN